MMCGTRLRAPLHSLRSAVSSCDIVIAGWAGTTWVWSMSRPCCIRPIQAHSGTVGLRLICKSIGTVAYKSTRHPSMQRKRAGVGDAGAGQPPGPLRGLHHQAADVPPPPPQPPIGRPSHQPAPRCCNPCTLHPGTGQHHSRRPKLQAPAAASPTSPPFVTSLPPACPWAFASNAPTTRRDGNPTPRALSTAPFPPTTSHPHTASLHPAAPIPLPPMTPDDPHVDPWVLTAAAPAPAAAAP